jgi:hypothetical protein
MPLDSNQIACESLEMNECVSKDLHALRDE